MDVTLATLVWAPAICAIQRSAHSGLLYTDHRYIKSDVDEVREPTFLVLTALAGGPLHGYAIIQEAEQLSKGRVRLRAGTLYATLDRLSADGLVEEAGEETVDGRFRRYYRLSKPGTALLAAESSRRMAVSKEAIRRLRVLGAWA